MNQLPVPYISVTFDSIAYSNFRTSIPMMFGNAAVQKELKSGNDPRFDEVRQNPLVKKFIIRKDKSELVGRDEIIEFSKYFMSQCNKLTPLIDSSRNRIGERVDIAIINPEKGIRWIK